MSPLEALERRIADLDAKIDPLIQRVDLSSPGRRAKRVAEGEQRRADSSPFVPVLDRGGIRDEAEAVLDDALTAFLKGTVEERDSIRALFQRFHRFTWAVAGARRLALPKGAPISLEILRDRLTFFATVDQGRDPRDAILELQYLCSRATHDGLPIAALLSEAVDLASDVPRFTAIGGGSTRALLLDAVARYGR
jgi:hypothetical protein